MADKLLIVVVGLHIDAKGRVLIQQRPAATKWGGLWEFPGGKVDRGETMRGALAREWKEELGVAIRVGEFITEAAIEFPDTAAILPLFRVHLDETPQALDGQVLRYAAFDEAMALPGVPSMAAYAKDVGEYVRALTPEE